MIKFNQNAWLKQYVVINIDLRKKMKKIFSSGWVMHILEKLWQMWEKIEITNWSQQKEEETIWCENQAIIQQIFWKSSGNRNEKNADSYE